MPDTLNTTPKFDKPPVIETVLGVQFEPLRNMRITHLGLFWEHIKDEFPEVEHHNPLEPVKESFDERLLGSGPRWRFSKEPDIPRAWFLSGESEQGQRLIQLQPDRFLQNWRRASLSAQDYPSYLRNRQEFVTSFEEFLRFVKENDLGEVLVNQCEVTYVNHIPIDDNSNRGQMFRKCFPIFQGNHSDDFLPANPEHVVFKSSYRIEGDRGRLHIEVQPVMEIKSRKELLKLILTARGAPSSTGKQDVFDWLDIGHFWVVKGFKSFTSAEMHARWGLVEA